MDRLEAKFCAFEIDDELEQMKAQMRSPSNQAGYNETHTVPKNNKTSCSYEILGLKPGTSLNEVKKAYRNLVKKWHPDVFFDKPQLQQKAYTKIQQINEAYANLCSKNS